MLNKPLGRRLLTCVLLAAAGLSPLSPAAAAYREPPDVRFRFRARAISIDGSIDCWPAYDREGKRWAGICADSYGRSVPKVFVPIHLGAQEVGIRFEYGQRPDSVWVELRDIRHGRVIDRPRLRKVLAPALVTSWQMPSLPAGSYEFTLRGGWNDDPRTHRGKAASWTFGLAVGRLEPVRARPLPVTGVGSEGRALALLLFGIAGALGLARRLHRNDPQPLDPRCPIHWL